MKRQEKLLLLIAQNQILELTLLKLLLKSQPKSVDKGTNAFLEETLIKQLARTQKAMKGASKPKDKPRIKAKKRTLARD